MKLLLLLVSAIAVLTADHPSLPENPDWDDSLDGQTSTDKEEHFANEPELHVFNEDDYQLRDGSMPIAGESSELGQRYMEEGQTRPDAKLRGSKCEGSVICSILGGSCISNALHCSGWLVSQGCNGTNCKCCIPGSLEIKTNTIELELQSVKDGLARLQDLPPAIDNITKTEVVVKQELQSLKMELRSTKINSNITNAILNETLHYIKKQGCSSNGLFRVPATNQCLKYLNDKTRNWNDAQARCASDGLQLAKPDNPIALRKFLVEVMGSSGHVFIGAKGTGSSFKWLRDGKTLSNSDAGWWSGEPSKKYTTSYCLDLVAHGSGVSNGKVYYSSACSSTRYALCEKTGV